MARHDVLARIPLLSGLDKRQLKALGKEMTEETFDEGAQVTTQGSEGTGFFAIVKGDAEVEIDGEKRGTLSDGDYFGEIALIDGGGRSASITATSHKLYSFGMSPDAFREFVEANPDVGWSLMQSLCARLREAEGDRG